MLMMGTSCNTFLQHAPKALSYLCLFSSSAANGAQQHIQQSLNSSCGLPAMTAPPCSHLHQSCSPLASPPGATWKLRSFASQPSSQPTSQEASLEDRDSSTASTSSQGEQPGGGPCAHDVQYFGPLSKSHKIIKVSRLCTHVCRLCIQSSRQPPCLFTVCKTQQRF